MKEFLSTLILISSISLFPDLLLAQRVVDRSDQELSYKRPIVKKVELKGMHVFKAGEVEKLLYTKRNHWFNFLQKRYLSKSNVRIDEATIKRFYMRRGYLFTQVQSDITYPNSNRAVVTFYVDEGRQTFLKSVSVSGGLDPINRKFGNALSILKIGKPVNAEDVISNGFKLRDLYADNGYPYAIDSSRYEFDSDSTQADLAYAVAESVFTIDDTTIIINKIKTKPYVIYRELLARPGRKYRQKDITDSEQRLYTTGLFKFVSMRRNDSTAVITRDTCHVGFDLGLDERKTHFWGLGLGLGNQQLYGTVFRTSIQGGIRNIAGTGRGVVLSLRPYFRLANTKNGSLSSVHLSDLVKKTYLTMVSSDVELDYVAPWLFKFRVPVTAKIIYEPYTLFPGIPKSDGTDSIPAYRFDRISGNMVFSRDIDRFTTAQLTASADYVKIRNVPADSAAFYRDQGNNQVRRRLLFYGQRDTRDNILVPQKGSYSFAAAEYVGGILGGDFDYYKMQFSWSRYNPLIGSNVLATRLWFGWLNDLFKNGRSAIADRFLIGGSTTIRGYLNNSINPDGGRYLFLGNAELRRPLFWRFGGTAFVDAGNTYTHFGQITFLSIRFSTGLGVQFFTPVGPIRLDYAVRLKKEFDLSAGLFHFSILYAF